MNEEKEKYCQDRLDAICNNFKFALFGYIFASRTGSGLYAENAYISWDFVCIIILFNSSSPVEFHGHRKERMEQDCKLLFDRTEQK